ncbi:hypothetical protein LZ32DRAFT_231431 [Colletotrichum eremochloae]|nr:hypothetical protein LZ32DRAFT_231431 [Colletotrichum eremochloae]
MDHALSLGILGSTAHSFRDRTFSLLWGTGFRAVTSHFAGISSSWSRNHLRHGFLTSGPPTEVRGNKEMKFQQQ